MGAIDRLIAGVQRVDELTAEALLEPKLGRADWAELTARVGLLRSAVDADVLGAVDDALAEEAEEEGVTAIQRRVAWLLAEAAAPVFANGDRATFQRFLARARQLAPDDELRALLDAGSANPELHCHFHHARWLQQHGRFGEADKILKGLVADSRDPAITRVLKTQRNAPRPLTSAPTLFRLNGCGVGLYGTRDARPDGSYIATYCLSLLWIPIVPLSAFRVRDQGDGSYQFNTSERLGPLARAWQAIALVGVLVAAGCGGMASYLESPRRLSQVAISEAEAKEASGDSEGAVADYKEAIRTFDGKADVVPAAEAVVRLTSGSVPEPCTPASVDRIGRIVNGFYDLPMSARAGAPAALLAKRLGAWADQIGDATNDHIAAGLTVLDMAAMVGEGGEKASIDARRSTLHRALAARVAGDRPVQALLHYAQVDDAAAYAATSAILDGFGDAPSLWVEVEPEVARWADAMASIPARQVDAAAVREKLKRARAAHAESKAILETGDAKAIGDALASRPGDQELTSAVANVRRDRGDIRAAIGLLTALGPPGRLTGDAQQLLGQCYADTGDLGKAEEVLSALVAERLPVFQQKQRDYVSAAQKVREQLVRDAQQGTLPSDLQQRLTGLDDAKQQSVFGEWLGERLRADQGLARRREEFVRHGIVVPASLALGTVRLGRAREADGKTRGALLAGAEQAFLAIRGEAEGEPSFHLGLGQVYHRLGKTREGDVELEGVLKRNDPGLGLAVARVYRELGQDWRARQIAEKVHETATAPETKKQAAFFRAHLHDGNDDEEKWLRLSDDTSPSVKTMLAEVAASRALLAGNLAEADKAYATAGAFYETEAASSAAGANNAAVTYLHRYGATGDPGHLRRAVALLETALRLDRENAIVLGHLSDALEHLGLVTVANKWVKTRTLMLEGSQAQAVLDMLAEGPLRGEVIEALRSDPSFRRALDLAKQEQILAPRKVSAYQIPIRWLRWTRDAAGLAELGGRIDALPELDSEDAAASRKAWESGEKDAEFGRVLVQRVVRARQRLVQAQKEANKPTVAIAWMMLGSALASQAQLNGSLPHAREAVEACRGAREAWPEGVQEDVLATPLAQASVQAAARESAAFDKLWRAEKRVFSMTLIFQHAMVAPAGAEMIAALRKQPELQEAVRARGRSMSDRPTLFDWALARMAGDAEAEQIAAKVFSRSEVERSLRIDAKLSAGDPSEKAYLDLFLEKKGAL